ncbi:MAG: prolyl oligopeptidase family serine peptidase [Armatimonadota bacterium]|nr:prolyl oligopeptidase family serine peptidase [Armatimonadota bacterium]MCX7777372.1 prolyl oligopeptidase family serine peptidase [Armatimonadota bacterium]MDW8025360.1 prolyl oligopeptidase family serine peptidase [Armatimonadota bacterium]
MMRAANVPKELAETHHSKVSRWLLLTMLMLCISYILAAPPFRRPLQRQTTLHEQYEELEVRYSRLERSLGSEEHCELGALARLKLDKAKIMLGGGSWWWSNSEIAKALREAEEAMNAWERKEDMLRGAVGLVERAYFSPADGSAQPYWVYVPQNYKPSSKHALIVFLHGYDPSINKANPWLLGDDIYRIADKHNLIILQPHGRKNTDFIHIGEQDVLEALKRTISHYSIDEDRIYLLGVSMGGYGAYIIALHNPHLFAAVAVVAARRYHFLWGELDQTTLPPPRACVLIAENPYMLAENALNFPTLIIHGEKDLLVPVANANLMAKRLSSFGCPATVNILRDESHWIYFDSSLFEKVFEWFEGKRRQALPKRLIYHTFTTAYNRAYWATIDELEEWCTRSTVKASALPNGTIFVNTRNVAALSLELHPELIKPAKKFRLILNGSTIAQGELVKPIKLSHRLRERKGVLAKTHNLCGPVWHAYMHRFIIVQGTLGDEETKAENEAKAKQLADEWVEFSDGVATILKDTEVTEEQIKQYNIIAVGGPNENRLVKLISGELPVRFLEDGYRIGIHEITTRAIKKKLGQVLVYPNPLNQSRYILIYDGVLWGKGLPINHKFDTLPDFTIFTEDQETDGANEIVCAGFFDTHWQVDGKLIWCKLSKCQSKPRYSEISSSAHDGD